jgi:hypothetical protein
MSIDEITEYLLITFFADQTERRQISGLNETDNKLEQLDWELQETGTSIVVFWPSGRDPIWKYY